MRRFLLLAVLPATLLAAEDVSVGGPTDAVRDLWAALSMDDEALAASADGLTAWFDEEGRHVLDRPLDFSFVEELAIEDLRAEDVVGLADVGWDPLRRTERSELDEQLSGARGILAAVPIVCSAEAVAAELGAETALKLRARDEVAGFAGVEHPRSAVRGTQVAWLDAGAGLRAAVVDVLVQPTPVNEDITIAQRWQVDLYLGRPDGSTLMLRAAWIEASSHTFSSESRVWTGWLLHEAFEDAERWNQHCRRQPAGPPSTSPAPESPPPIPAPRTSTATPDAPPAESPAQGPPPPPLCPGIQLVEIHPWALRNVETRFSYSDSISGENETITVDREAIERWSLAGARAWGRVLNVRRPQPHEQVQLQRLAERFGDAPRLLNEESKALFRARWHAGLLREVLSADPVVVPVCADDLDRTAAALGYAERRSEKAGAIEEVTAVALLEHGSVASVPDASWQAVSSALAFGDAILDVFGRPNPALDGVVPDDGAKSRSKKTFDIDAVDRNL
jgi:hypothetical protein